MSELRRRDCQYSHITLESVTASFPLPKVHDVTKDKTTLKMSIEQTGHDRDEGKGLDWEPPRLRIEPSHGWGGFTRAECEWIARTIPELWDEWERKVGSRPE